MSMRDPVVTERWALAVLRVSLGVFLLVWGLEKFAIPMATVGIWTKFYGVGLAASLVPLVGALESVLALAITAGFYESDSQGETSLPLMAQRFPPAQSAPCAESTRSCGAAGIAAQSASSASVSALLLPIRAGRSQALGSHDDANHGSIRDSARGPA
jgi:hypothetical protein